MRLVRLLDARNRGAVDYVPRRLGPATLRQAQDHHRSGRSRAGRNRPAIDPVADPVAANRSSRHNGGDGRCLAQRRSRAHACACWRSLGAPISRWCRELSIRWCGAKRKRNSGSSNTAPCRGWERGLRGDIIRPISWAKCRRASRPPSALNEDAAHFLVRMVHKYPHEITIYEGGPMTNLALAIIHRS